MADGKIDLENAPIIKTFISYAIPSILGMLMLSVAGIVDGLFIGRFVGTNALAAVSIVYPITSLAIGFAIMIGTGGAATAAAQVGAGNIPGARNTFTITAILVTIFALVLTILGIIFGGNIAIIFGSKGNLEEEIKDYLIPLLIFFIPFMHAWILDMFIRNDGFPTFPSVVLVISAVINILLDYLFVARLGYGLPGAAVATGGSQLIPTIIFWIFIVRGKTSYRVVVPTFKYKFILKMLYNGLSEFINEFSVGISAILFNYVLLSRIGSVGVASYAIVQYVSMISMMIFFGVAQASQPGISFNLGVGSLKRILGFRRVALITNISVGIIATFVLIFGGEYIASIFTKNDMEVVILTKELSIYYSFAYLPMALNITYSMFFTSIHYARQSAVTAALRSLILFIIGLYTLPIILGNKGLWLTVPFAEWLTFVVVLFLLYRHPITKEYLSKMKEVLSSE